MYGLVNRSLQSFLRIHYGSRAWKQVADRIGVGEDGFETMLDYDDAITDDLISAACQDLGVPKDILLEDFGSYLVTVEPLRRLLRFGGGDYWEFLFSLDEIRERGQIALPGLELPTMHLVQVLPTEFIVEIRGRFTEWGPVIAGLLRALADDYGALAMIEVLSPSEGGAERVQVAILETDYADGRRFVLVGPDLRRSV